MKKILLSLGLFSLVMVGKSQTVLNELYTDPGGQTLRAEFIELYNSGAGAQNVDCFTILTYYDNGGQDKGWYVMDLPNLNVAAKGYFVLAAGNPFTTQNTPLPGAVPNFNWNDPLFRNGSTGGSLKKFQINGGGYTDVTASIPATFNNFLSGGQGQDYVVLVFVNGVFSNGFVGGKSTASLGATTATLSGNLNVDMNVSGGCPDFVVNFNNVSTNEALESVGSQPGSDNGYARVRDGKCGAWKKTSASIFHTPGVTNNNDAEAGDVGAMVTAEILFCNSLPNTVPKKSHISFDITGLGNSGATEADDFAVEVILYYDYPPLGPAIGTVVGPEDIFQRSKFQNTVAAPADTFQIDQTQPVILIYKTQRGCFDKIVSIANNCIALPVNFKSFTATRNSSNVLVKWETSSEVNNSGFAVERNVNGTWIQVAYVPTQAAGGNSDDLLTYTFNDLNSNKGVSQYRIKQIDIDAQSKYSEVRSVRGDGQAIKTIVYPNPSTDGKVNVVFEDSKQTREVSVMDMSGRLIKQFKGVTNNNITIENLTPGIYSLRVFVPATGEQAVQKIVVNKQ